MKLLHFLLICLLAFLASCIGRECEGYQPYSVTLEGYGDSASNNLVVYILDRASGSVLDSVTENETYSQGVDRFTLRLPRASRYLLNDYRIKINNTESRTLGSFIYAKRVCNRRLFGPDDFYETLDGYYLDGVYIRHTFTYSGLVITRQ